MRRIIVSGDHQTPAYDEPNAMRAYLEASGVPPQVIFMDHAGIDTYSSVWRAKHETSIVATPQKSVFLQAARAVFFSHSRALATLREDCFADARVWTSGTNSWFRLAARGIWVEGCAEGLGFDNLKRTLEESVLQLPDFNQWNVLTHTAALEDWKSLLPEQNIIPTYELDVQYNVESKAQLSQASDFFWSSGSQFNALKTVLSPERFQNGRHACGPGKTAQEITEALACAGKLPLIFPSAEEWRKWIKN